MARTGSSIECSSSSTFICASRFKVVHFERMMSRDSGSVGTLVVVQELGRLYYAL